ncbi:CDC42 small effector protein 1 [Phodopus roborovskii]|uniref:CDC42 small effector protein 1 n=1 Tax=Phodopus roborovskii TaxID=109678 RepID=UPI0021E45F52|nr:CDC42 small effector protein 1 [Phodopus roborovskii]
MERMPQGLAGPRGLWETREGPRAWSPLHLQQVDRPSADTWGPAGVRERGASRCPRGPRRVPRQAWAERCARLAARGFRNRVAGVSALGRPHLCRPALESPPCRAAAPEPGVAEPPPAAATAWTPGSRRQNEVVLSQTEAATENRDRARTIHRGSHPTSGPSAARGVWRVSTQGPAASLGLQPDFAHTILKSLFSPAASCEGLSDSGLEALGLRQRDWENRFGATTGPGNYLCTSFLPRFLFPTPLQLKKRRRRIDRTMIGEPMNFVHLTHIGSGEMGAGDGLAMG